MEHETSHSEGGLLEREVHSPCGPLGRIRLTEINVKHGAPIYPNKYRIENGGRCLLEVAQALSNVNGQYALFYM